MFCPQCRLAMKILLIPLVFILPSRLGFEILEKCYKPEINRFEYNNRNEIGSSIDMVYLKTIKATKR